MRLYPAIDIKDGQCVRLKKGLFNEVTVYSDTPYKIAKRRRKIYSYRGFGRGFKGSFRECRND